MPDDRKIWKNAALAMAYGSKTGRFSSSRLAQYYQEFSRTARFDPPQYTGEPLFCTVCRQPMVKASMGVKRCECRHDVRQRETKQAAMERRAHWLLKREFDAPDVYKGTTSEHVVLVPPRDMTEFLVDYEKLEKRMATAVYGGTVTNNKDEP